MVQFICFIKNIMITTCLIVCHKTIYAIRHGIRMFNHITWCSIIISRPVQSTIFLIITVPMEILIGMPCCFKILYIAKLNMCSGKQPHYSANQNSPLFTLLINLKIIIHCSIEAAVFLIHKVHPEWENTINKVILSLIN